jgi:NAD(P)-dependent dehydrogenase (short-subunit alcohol dehydrogenase family)
LNRTALVTGATRGIGAEVARALAREKVNLVLAVRSAEAGKALAEELRHLEVEVAVIQCDVSKYFDVQAMIKTALQTVGQIDILVNNAGTMDPIGLAEDCEPESWAHCLAVNLAGPYFTIREMLPHFRRRGSGAIVNLSTGAAFMPLRGWSAYCSSKAGLAMLTKVVAQELSGTDIRVYGFQPGMVNTEMTREGLKQAVNPVAELDVESFLHPAQPASAIVALCLRRPVEFQGTEVRYTEPGFIQWMGEAGIYGEQ